MNYFDDILNVYAYLFSKSAENAETSCRLTEKAKTLGTSFRTLNTQADALLSDLDALLTQAYALAETMNMDTTRISGGADAGTDPLPDPVSGTVSAQIRIPLPVNFNYQKDFQRLVKEAHAAGFTDAHPEELLTPEELARAEEFSDQLDEEFCAATRLQPKDMAVLSIAVAVRVLCYFLSKKIRIDRNQRKEQEMPLPQVSVSGPETATAPHNIQTQSGVDVNGAQNIPPIYAAQGVDITGMLNNMANHGNAVKTGQIIADEISRKLGSSTHILDHNTILEQNAPFDIQETDLFDAKDIVAYHKYLGWLIGTVNILTDTITTYQMKSYSITRPMHTGLEKPCVDREISTLLGVVNPVVRSAGFYKESIAAAVVQEALTQGFGKAAPEQVRTLFGRAMELENNTTAITEETKGLVGNLNPEWAAGIGSIAVTTLINTIISAVHAILYEESDGSLDTYSIRTSRIILYSGGIATTINSLPAIASRSVADLDFTGMLTTCMSWFQSTRFWIEAKTAFLVSAHKKELDVQLAKLDKYFQYQI